MGRKIASVIGAYLVTAIVIVVVMNGAYAILGSEAAYKPGSYEVSMTWNVLTLVLGFAAAFVGSMACYAISYSRRALIWFGVLLLVLGVVYAYPTIGVDPPTDVRSGAVPVMEAMLESWQPAWVGLMNPVVGILGIVAFCLWKKPED